MQCRQQKEQLFYIDQESLQGLEDAKTILLEPEGTFDNQHQQDFQDQLKKYTNMLQSNQLPSTIVNILEPQNQPLANMDTLREDAIQVLFGMMEYPIKLDQVDKLVPRSARFDEKEMSFRLQLVDYGRDWAEELLFDILSVPKSLKPPPVDHFNIHNQLSTIQSVAQEFLLKTFKDQKGHISTQTLCNVSRALAEEIEVEEDFLKWTEVLIQASGKDLTGLSDSFMKRLLEKPPRPTSQHHQIDGIEQQEIESTCLFDQLEIETKVCLWANVPTLWDEQLKKCLIAVHASPFLHVNELLFGSIDDNNRKTLQSRFCQSFQEFPHLHVLMVEFFSRSPYVEFLTTCRSMELYSTLCKSTRTSFHSLQGLFATPMLSHLMVRFYEKPHSQEIACLFFQAFQKSNTQNSLSHVKEWMLALESPLLLFQAFQIAFGSDVAATATVGAAAASGGGSGSAMMMNQEVQEVQVSLESHHQKRKNAICYIVWFYCFFNPKSCVFFKEILDEMEIKLIKTSSPAFAIEWLQKNRCHFHQQFTLQRIRIIWSYLLSHLNQLCCTQLTEILSCIEYMLRRFIVPSIKEEQITKRSFQIGIMTQLLYDMEMFLLVKKKTNQKQFVQKKTHLNSLINWLKKVIQIMQSDDQIKLEIHHIQLVLKRFDYFKSLTNTK